MWGQERQPPREECTPMGTAQVCLGLREKRGACALCSEAEGPGPCALNYKVQSWAGT